MKIKKIFASVAAVAMMATMFSTAASAADWSQAGYADNDPGTVKIISTDANGATFTQGEAGSCKLRITVDQVLANPDDAAKIKSATWKMTYSGFTAANDFGWMGGGAYMATTNSAGFGLSPAYTEDGAPDWTSADAVVSVEDSVKYLLPSSIPAADGEFVFMDWSGVDLVGNGITVTVSDLKIFDADGNELAQKAYAGAAEAAVVEESTAAPADGNTASAGTGNTAAAAIASVMAVAGAAAIAAKKRK